MSRHDNRPSGGKHTRNRGLDPSIPPLGHLLGSPIGLSSQVTAPPFPCLSLGLFGPESPNPGGTSTVTTPIRERSLGSVSRANHSAPRSHASPRSHESPLASSRRAHPFARVKVVKPVPVRVAHLPIRQPPPTITINSDHEAVYVSARLLGGFPPSVSDGRVQCACDVRLPEAHCFSLDQSCLGGLPRDLDSVQTTCDYAVSLSGGLPRGEQSAEDEELECKAAVTLSGGLPLNDQLSELQCKTCASLDENPFLVEGTHTLQVWYEVYTPQNVPVCREIKESSVEDIQLFEFGLFVDSVGLHHLNGDRALMERYLYDKRRLLVDVFFQKRWCHGKEPVIDDYYQHSLERSWRSFCQALVKDPSEWFIAFFKKRDHFFRNDVQGIKSRIHLLCREARLHVCYVPKTLKCPLCKLRSANASSEQFVALSEAKDLELSEELQTIKQFVILLRTKLKTGGVLQASSSGVCNAGDFSQDAEMATSLLVNLKRQYDLLKAENERLVLENETLRQSMRDV